MCFVIRSTAPFSCWRWGSTVQQSNHNQQRRAEETHRTDSTSATSSTIKPTRGHPGLNSRPLNNKPVTRFMAHQGPEQYGYLSVSLPKWIFFTKHYAIKYRCKNFVFHNILIFQPSRIPTIMCYNRLGIVHRLKLLHHKLRKLGMLCSSVGKNQEILIW